MKSSSGFTLIELLVVMAVIGVLTVAGASTFRNSQQISRNSRRVADLKTLQTTLETYYANNNQYPQNAACDPGTTYYPQGMPKDPKTNAAYAPVASCIGALTYCFCSQLEGTGEINGANAGSNACTPASYAATPRSFYCINNLQ